jgi:hypothetical protein
MASGGPPPYDRVLERRRAVAPARHYRQAEGLPVMQIADGLGRSRATIKAYFHDLTGEKARAVKARATSGCAAAVAPTRRRGTATATRTCNRPATRARSSPAGPLSPSSMRCVSGSSATAGCPPRMTGRAHTHGEVGGGVPSDRVKDGGLPASVVPPASEAGVLPAPQRCSKEAQSCQPLGSRSSG